MKLMRLDPHGGGWGFFGWNLVKDLQDLPKEEDDTVVLMLGEEGRVDDTRQRLKKSGRNAVLKWDAHAVGEPRNLRGSTRCV